MRKKAVYNEKIEKQLSDITNYFYLCEIDKDENIINELLNLYEENKYPGILYNLGIIYLYGNHECEINEEKAIEYLKQAANEGYLEAIEVLGDIYTSKAQQQLNEAKYWYDQLGLEYNSAYGKFSLGTNLMADYLLSSSGTQSNYYNNYYEGLGLVAESFQMGLSEANLILNVLDKDKKFMDNYKQMILESKRNLIHEIYSVSEDDLISNDEFEDYDEYIFDEE